MPESMRLRRARVLNGTARLREATENRRWGHPRQLTRLARQMRLIRVAPGRRELGQTLGRCRGSSGAEKPLEAQDALQRLWAVAESLQGTTTNRPSAHAERLAHMLRYFDRVTRIRSDGPKDRQCGAVRRRHPRRTLDQRGLETARDRFGVTGLTHALCNASTFRAPEHVERNAPVQELGGRSSEPAPQGAGLESKTHDDRAGGELFSVHGPVRPGDSKDAVDPLKVGVAIRHHA